MTNKIDKDTLSKRSWITISLHVLIWLMIFLIPYIFSASMEGVAGT